MKNAYQKMKQDSAQLLELDADYASQKPGTGENFMTRKQTMMEDGLGELEDIGQFGLGLAVRDAKPVNKLELSKEKEAEIARMQEWEAFKEVDEDLKQEQEDAAQLDRLRRNKKSQSDRRPPTDRQTAFVEFK